ncbi:glycoside hydrolase family 3 C-terminal domain-containing protein [Antribacter gilvus]|uniref:glycoside hydrolase family 3 C-terminal domain-containing protein n=1 Tax=Antribacter gilvus TaxID=2304675 RepID=UPI000F7B4302|nr:glycoside hydrolase family 3 C-terminal domain-containing protein [Antribacter gilvus]
MSDTFGGRRRRPASPRRGAVRRARLLALAAVCGVVPLLVTTAAPAVASVGAAEPSSAQAPRPTGHVTDVVVGANAPVVLAEDGESARVTLRVEVSDGAALARPVTVAWATGQGTAAPAADYEIARGTVTFPAGAPSGAERTVEVSTRTTPEQETAETVPLTLSSLGARVGTTPTIVIGAHGLPYLDPTLPTGERVADLLSRMTLDEKVGQLVQVERSDATSRPEVITERGLGVVVANPGSAPARNTAEAWADMADDLQLRALATRLQVPLLVGIDGVHGHDSLPGATLVPHRLGLAATDDPALVRGLAQLVRDEARATGVTWVRAPQTEPLTDVRSGDAYTRFGADRGRAARLADAASDPVTEGLGEALALAGEDPEQHAGGWAALVAAVRSGEVPAARLDEAVSTVLTAKVDLGLFEAPFADRSQLAVVGSAEHRAQARDAVAASQVLLQDRDGTLPLDAGERVYVAGRSADDLGNQAGGWTVTWQGSSGEPTQGSTILDGIRELDPDATFSADASAPATGHDVGVVVVGETPYAGSYGDVGGPSWAWDQSDAGVFRETKSLELQPGDADVVQQVCDVVPTCVVVVVSGRPQAVDLRVADAVVAAWLPGTEGAGVADPLYGAVPFTGRLPVAWPQRVDPAGEPTGEFPVGAGLTP